LTTNGLLLDKYRDKLLSGNVNSYGISMHAATAETHDKLMHLGNNAYNKIIEGIHSLVEARRNNPKIHVIMIFILMSHNIHEIPSYIRLCHDLCVDKIFIRTLAPRNDGEEIFGLNYYWLAPYLNPEFDKLCSDAIEAIQRSRIPVVSRPETWGNHILPLEIEKCFEGKLPKSMEERIVEVNKRYANTNSCAPSCGERLDGEGDSCLLNNTCNADNPHNRKPPYECPSPYTAFYINHLNQVNPCCYISNKIPGHNMIYYDAAHVEDRTSTTDYFKKVWNSPAMLYLRDALFHGPLLKPCLSCPYYW
jgi:MoaA/NifB/PqqE/SkfB family radical SAM enzyme